eukprot:CCRYP_010538-RB/>CCRYP_010538-RB protein AED:0.45 eAED:0.45 QI:0/-1/0/1/-1/0/1/0/88
MSSSLSQSYEHCGRMASLLIRSNANGQFRRLTGSAIGLNPEVLSHGRRKLRLSSTWIALAMPQNCACSLAVLIIIVIWGLVVPIFSSP